MVIIEQFNKLVLLQISIEQEIQQFFITEKDGFF